MVSELYRAIILNSRPSLDNSMKQIDAIILVNLYSYLRNINGRKKRSSHVVDCSDRRHGCIIRYTLRLHGQGPTIYGVPLLLMLSLDIVKSYA